MTELTIIYHNATGKRNRMTINMDVFFPCAKIWLNKLLKTVISRSDDPERYTGEIRTYLSNQLEQVDQWVRDNSCGEGPMIGVRPADYKKKINDLNRIRACLDLIGGADEQHNSNQN